MNLKKETANLPGVAETQHAIEQMPNTAVPDPDPSGPAATRRVSPDFSRQIFIEGGYPHVYSGVYDPATGAIAKPGDKEAPAGTLFGVQVEDRTLRIQAKFPDGCPD